SDRSVIVIPIEPDAGAAGLAGLSSDRNMRQHLNLDGDLAGGWRDALADPDRDPWGDVFPGAERGAAGRRIALTPGVQGSGRRPGGARAQPEPIEAEAAAQAVEHSGTAPREAGGSRGELEPLPGGALTDALA